MGCSILLYCETEHTRNTQETMAKSQQAMDIFKYDILSFVGTPFLNELKHQLLLESVCLKTTGEFLVRRIKKRSRAMAHSNMLRKRVPYILEMKSCLYGEARMSELYQRPFEAKRVIASANQIRKAHKQTPAW